MNASDTVLWAIERDPLLRSTVTAVALLDGVPNQRRLHQRVEHTVEMVPRLRQHVAESLLGFGRPRWVEGEFDLDFHLRWVGAVPGDERWLWDFAASLAEAGFDRNRPLWEMVVVEGLDDGTAALVLKLHHSLTDGVGAVAMMGNLLDWTRHPGGGTAVSGELGAAAPPAPTHRTTPRAARAALGVVPAGLPSRDSVNEPYPLSPHCPTNFNQAYKFHIKGQNSSN